MMNTYTNSTTSKPVIGVAPAHISQLINHHVLEVHAEEAAFLWTQHANAVNRPDYDLKDIIELDERINAHLDGLRVANRAGWQHCLNLLDEGAEHLFPATILALAQQNRQWLDVVVNALLAQVNNESYSATKPMISALGWLGYAQVESQIALWLTDGNVILQYVALAALSLYRQDPQQYLNQFIRHTCPYIRARAYRLVGELKRHDLSAELYQALQESNSSCCFWAAWSLALLGDRDVSLQRLAEYAMLSTPLSEHSFKYQWLALQILVTVEPANSSIHKQRLQRMAQSEQLLPARVYALGLSGAPSRVNELIALMAIPEVAKLAGEAFCTITGVDLDYDDLMLDEDSEADEPLPDIAAVNFADDDDNDEAEEQQNNTFFLQQNYREEYQTYTEELLLPDVALIQSWWQAHQHNFDKNRRYLAGLAVTEHNLHQLVKYGRQRQRQQAALILTLEHQSQRLLNTQGPGLSQ